MPLTRRQNNIIIAIEESAKAGEYVEPVDTLFLIRLIREMEKEATNGND